MIRKASLHRLVDELPEAALEEAERYLAALRDHPLAHMLVAAPLDDEPETAEEQLAVQEAREATRQGDLVADDNLDRDLGR